MCGIAGVFQLDGAPVERGTLQRMAQQLAHRGPDAEGCFVEDNLGLSHRRLAILDTSDRGNQPMSSKDGRWVLVFNGCAYNYLELQLELKARGHSFVSASDTEVIVEGLAADGPAFLERLNGMFAVAAWDRRERVLHLWRDRYGVKPLYYWCQAGVLVFASEIKAILAHPAVTVGLDYAALNEYFTFQNVLGTATLFAGVKPLPPGGRASLSTTKPEVAPEIWWDFDFGSPDESMTFEDAQRETERLLRRAVARQMVADVPVGSYLSGGLDSGSLTALASTHLRRLTTFTCGFDMSSVTGVEANYDERRDAEVMANAFKTEHYEQVINAGDLAWSLPRVVYHLEDLRLGMSYPNFYISRLASKFVKVCLAGAGGDELFGGYPWRYYRVFRSVDRQEYLDLYYEFWQRLVPDGERARLFTPEVARQVDPQAPRRAFDEVFRANPRLQYDTPEQHIGNSMYFESKTFLPGLLTVGDKLSMAHGLEERVPFLDDDLVRWAQLIPVRHKLGNLEKMLRIDENELRDKRRLYSEFDDGKNVLRASLQNVLPEAVVKRKKQGFSAPDASWYRGENAAYVKALLLNRKTVCADFIDPAYIETVIDRHMREEGNFRLLLWSFMSFEWWCRLFLNRESLP